MSKNVRITVQFMMLMLAIVSIATDDFVLSVAMCLLIIGLESNKETSCDKRKAKPKNEIY